MDVKRSIGVLVLALVLAAGCSSSGSGDQSSSTTQITAPDGSPVTTTNSVPVAPSGTAPARDALPVVRAPDNDAFCTAFYGGQDLLTEVNNADFEDNALVLIAAPDKLRLQAQLLRVTAPDALFDQVDPYAGLFDQAGNDLQNVKTLRQLKDALVGVNNAISVDQYKPMVDWVIKNCPGA